MQRTLSARSTPLLKFVLAPAWTALAAYVGWQLLFHPADIIAVSDTGVVAPATRWLLLVLLTASLAVLLAFVVPLKRVALTPDGLRISNYRREITVPFSAIARVRQNWLPTFRLVTVDLSSATPLGRRVIFMPAGAGRVAFWRAAYWQQDPVVTELQSLVGDVPGTRAAPLAT